MVEFDIFYFNPDQATKGEAGRGNAVNDVADMSWSPGQILVNTPGVQLLTILMTFPPVLL